MFKGLKVKLHTAVSYTHTGGERFLTNFTKLQLYFLANRLTMIVIVNCEWKGKKSFLFSVISSFPLTKSKTKAKE